MIVKNIITDIENSIAKQQYNESKQMFKDVGEFIKKKNLLLYGGFAINQLLPKNKRFYKDYTLNDYDCLSPSARKDAYELSEYLKKKNYQYVKVRKAIHDNTFKVFANFIVVADLTQIEKKRFDNLLTLFKEEKSSPMYRYYKDDYKLVPVFMLFSNMHYELARPQSSYYRWEKILKRLESLQSIIPKTIIKDAKQSICQKKLTISKHIDAFLKKNKIPRVDASVLQQYNVYYCDPSKISIISHNLKETTDSLKSFLKKLDYSIISTHNIVYVYDKDDTKNILVKITVFDSSNDCFATEYKNKLVGTPHTVMYFMYEDLLLNANQINVQMFRQLLALEKTFHNKNLNNILSKECSGNNKSFVSILKEKWGDPQTLKYF
jgi:hypothetical protein